MGILHGLSLGVFIVVAGCIVLLFIGIGLSILGEVVEYQLGEVTFDDMSRAAQWIVVTFFNDGMGV